MSDQAYAHSDNQFVAKRPLRSTAPRLTRTDYSSTLVKSRVDNLSPSNDKLDNYSQTKTVGSSFAVKIHRSHRPLVSHDFFKAMLGSESPKRRFKLPKPTKFQYGMVSLAIVFLLGGGYFTVTGWLSVNTAKVQAFKLTNLANQASKGNGQSSALSTTPISASTLASYVVAPSLPRYLIIPKLGVDARVLSVGVTSSGALAAPNNVFDTAWYNESALPGQPGATLIDGHISSWTTHGVFYGLKTLAPGDLIKLQRGDGTVFTYKVAKTQIYPASNVNMQAAITPVVAGQPGLNLISCTGDVIPGTSTFSQRIIVFATIVN